MSLLIKGKKGFGHSLVVERGKGASTRITFSLMLLPADESYQEFSGENEVAVVILGGRCSVNAGAQRWPGVGDRRDVFSGRAAAVYVPPREKFSITGESAETEVALCRAHAGDLTVEKTGPGDEDARVSEKSGSGGPVLIRPDDVRVRQVGKDEFYREVHDVIGPEIPALRLLVGETFNLPGRWSSYPPHKHDMERPPTETRFEEVYHFRTSPAQGFGLQRIYTDDRLLDVAYAVEDGDTVVIPKGYHPVAAAPGYSLYYLWILAGDTRRLIPYDDPDHAWLK